MKTISFVDTALLADSIGGIILTLFVVELLHRSLLPLCHRLYRLALGSEEYAE
jgi:hypothetical protein